MNEEIKIDKKKCYIVMGVAILCLFVIVMASSYAYFVARVEGTGADINIQAGTVKLDISESVINASNVLPIRDTSKDTKANTNPFTISLSDDSDLNACYSLYLVVDSIGSNLQNEYFKYELVYDGGTISGNFDSLTFEDDGTAKIGLLANQTLTSTDNSDSYTLRVWLSYSETEDQSFILTGDADSRTFNARIVASGQSGVCE